MKRTALLIIIALICAGICLTGCSKPYDIVILSGTVYDGSGSGPAMADIGIKNGVIKTIGTFEPDADVVIDGQNLYVCPGFIDIHNHASFNKEQTTKRGGDYDEIKIVKNYLTQGVTTLVSGNCGGGTYKVAELFDRIRKDGAGLNVMQLVGHGTVRSKVMGPENRAPSGEELEEMKKLVREAMEGGAVGMSTGLFYAPGSYAKTEEVIELAKVVGEYGGIYATHVRDEGVNMMGGIEAGMSEAIRIGEEAGVPVQISHLKAAGTLGMGKAQAVTALFEAAQARGLKLCADQYPYKAGSTSLAGILINRWMMAGGEEKMIERFEDPALHDRIIKEITDRIDRYTGPDNVVISRCREQEEFEGKTLREISSILDKSPAETVIELIKTSNPGCVVFMMRDEDVEYFMQKPYVMTSSDGGNTQFGEGVPHPRNYGAFTKKIRTYAMDKGIISLEHAIRAATSLPADMLGLSDRGLIREGFAADILVFDPEKIRDNATYAQPHQYSSGIEFLIINGKTVIENGEYNGALAGIPIERK